MLKKRNSTTMSLVLILILILILSLSLAGCQGMSAELVENPEDKPLTKAQIEVLASKELETHGNKVPKLKQTNYFVRNNITYETVRINQDDKYNMGEYVQIDGLKNKEVQKIINDDIRNSFFEMYNKEEYPAYRGINAKLRSVEGITPTHSTYSYMGAGSNNIITVTIAKSSYYSGDNWLSIYDEDTKNYDLNTGEVLNLKDVFIDDFDYVTYINEKVKEYINQNSIAEEDVFSYYGQMKLTSGFETIKADSKFRLDDYKHSISLLLDSSMPEFDLNFAPGYIEIDISECSALNQRFVSEESIFEDETKKYRLIGKLDTGKISSYEEESFDLEELIGMGEIPGLEDAEIYKSVTYRKGMPKEGDRMIEAYFEEDQGFAEEIAATAQILSEKYGEGPIDIYADMSAEQITNMVYPYQMMRATFSLWPKGQYEAGREYREIKFVTFDPKTGKILNLEDVFKKNVDYEALIKTAWKKEIVEYMERVEAEAYSDYELNLLASYRIYEERIDEYIDMVYETIDGFSLLPDMIEFGSKDKRDIALNFLGIESPEENQDFYNFLTYSVLGGIAYEDIGFENFSLFN